MDTGIFSNINPLVTSGTQLASLLNLFKDGVANNQKTTDGTRPTNLTSGGLWVDAQNSPYYVLKQYDGTTDHTLLTLNISTGILSLGSQADSLTITKNSDDSVGPYLNLFKRRTAGTGQTQDGDTSGELRFSGRTDAGVEELLAKIQAYVTDDITSSNQGCDLLFFTTPDAGATLTQNMTLKGSGLLGIGETSPAARVHVNGSSTTGNIKNELVEDSTVGATLTQKKRRSTGNGQVLNNDIISNYISTAHDQNGAEQTTSKIESKAIQNITNTEHGTEINFYSVKTGETSLSLAMKLKEGKILNADGKHLLEYSESSLLQDASATRNLITLDGSVYGCYVIEALFYGRDNTPETRAQKTTINAVYNYNTSQWIYSKKDETLTDTAKLIEYSFTNGASLVIDYVNQFVNANFLDGSIHLIIKRALRA